MVELSLECPPAGKPVLASDVPLDSRELCFGIHAPELTEPILGELLQVFEGCVIGKPGTGHDTLPSVAPGVRVLGLEVRVADRQLTYLGGFDPLR